MGSMNVFGNFVIAEVCGSPRNLKLFRPEASMERFTKWFKRHVDYIFKSDLPKTSDEKDFDTITAWLLSVINVPQNSRKRDKFGDHFHELRLGDDKEHQYEETQIFIINQWVSNMRHNVVKAPTSDQLLSALPILLTLETVETLLACSRYGSYLESRLKFENCECGLYGIGV